MFNPAQPSNCATSRPLNQLKAGQEGLVDSIELQKDENLRELTRLGVTPRAFIQMFANHRSNCIFKVDGKTIAADRETAAGILVRPV